MNTAGGCCDVLRGAGLTLGSPVPGTLVATLTGDVAPVYTISMLRPYQTRAIEQLRASFRRGKRRVILVAPTGAGKTTIAAEIIRSAVARGKRVWFVAHRRELITQCSARLDAHGVQHGIIQAGNKRVNPDLQVQVVSIQTIVRREISEVPDLVIVDESHRARGATYLQVFDMMPEAFVLGLTATPLRLDGKPLGEGLFEDMVIVAQPRELIEDGHLLAPRIFSVQPKNLDAVPAKGIDYDTATLSDVMLKVVADNVSEWSRFKPKRTVCFAVTVEHSKAICAEFSKANVKAEHVDAHTPKLERDAILARLRSGDTQVVCNVGILTEGWDLPDLDCVLITRPTKSLSLYLQMAGRGMRPAQGKSEFLLLDNGGCYKEHGLPHADRTWSLKGRIKDETLKTRQCPQCFFVAEGRPDACPECGFVFPASEEEEKEKDDAIEGVLVEVKGQELEERHAELVRLYTVAAERGYRRGWVQHRFNAKHEIPATTKECGRAKRESLRNVSSRSQGSHGSGSGEGMSEQQRGKAGDLSGSDSPGSQISAESLGHTGQSWRSSARPTKDASLYLRDAGSTWSDHREAVHSWFVRQTMLSSK